MPTAAGKRTADSLPGTLSYGPVTIQHEQLTT